MIIAKKVFQIVEMPSGHYSRSEGPEVIDIRWEYSIPEGYVFSSLEEDGAIPIVSEEEKEVIGYAVPGFYACYGKVYSNKNEIPDSDYQGEQPMTHLKALEVAAKQRQQMEEGCYGD